MKIPEPEISRLGKRLQVRQQAMATAQLYVRRFYSKVEIRRTNPYLVIATAVYLACKMEESPQHIRLVVTEARSLWPGIRLLSLCLLEIHAKYILGGRLLQHRYFQARRVRIFPHIRDELSINRPPSLSKLISTTRHIQSFPRRVFHGMVNYKRPLYDRPALTLCSTYNRHYLHFVSPNTSTCRKRRDTHSWNSLRYYSQCCTGSSQCSQPTKDRIKPREIWRTCSNKSTKAIELVSRK